jgi:metal-sulfur cluster biosynthetic enzyme
MVTSRVPDRALKVSLLMTDMSALDPSVKVPATDPTLMARFTEESAVYGALRQVVDPELNIDVVELALIRQIILKDDSVEILMVLTTPFCPYGPALIEEVRVAAEEATGKPTTVRLLAERWDPHEAGLVW